jgi:flavin reductase (DIM6/NTAB) family NADH-FMN oxidoreductase RutF
MKTIECNATENDEITEAGFTLETPHKVRAPRIAECSVNLECKLEWERPLCTGSDWHLFTGKVVHLAVEDLACELDPLRRMKNLKTMYNLRSTLNPVTGETGGDGLPVIGGI